MLIIQSSELKYCQIQGEAGKNQQIFSGAIYKNRQFIKLESYTLNQFKSAQQSCQKLLEQNQTVIIVKEAECYSLWSLFKLLPQTKNTAAENLPAESNSSEKADNQLSGLLSPQKMTKLKFLVLVPSFLLLLAGVGRIISSQAVFFDSKETPVKAPKQPVTSVERTSVSKNKELDPSSTVEPTSVPENKELDPSSTVEPTSVSEDQELNRSSTVELKTPTGDREESSIEKLPLKTSDGETTSKFINPINRKTPVISSYGRDLSTSGNKQRFHNGIDLGASLGTPVLAVSDGVVVYVSKGCPDSGNSEKKINCGGKLGNWIDIKHSNGLTSRYGHLQQGSVMVSSGMKVTQGQQIGAVGVSGWSTGPHLDFRIHDGKENYLDPSKYIPVNYPQ